MTKIITASGFLFPHNSSIDIYCRPLKEAIKSIPEGILKLQHGCFPIIMDYNAIGHRENMEESPFSEIFLGFGYHHSDFKENEIKPVGLIFNINPPYTGNTVKKVEMFQINDDQHLIKNYPSFMIKSDKFIIENKIFDLDKIVCTQLTDCQPYVKRVLDHSNVGEYHSYVGF